MATGRMGWGKSRSLYVARNPGEKSHRVRGPHIDVPCLPASAWPKEKDAIDHYRERKANDIIQKRIRGRVYGRFVGLENRVAHDLPAGKNGFPSSKDSWGLFARIVGSTCRSLAFMVSFLSWLVSRCRPVRDVCLWGRVDPFLSTKGAKTWWTPSKWLSRSSSAQLIAQNRRASN